MYNSIMYDIILPKGACRVLMHMHLSDKQQPTTGQILTRTVLDIPGHLIGRYDVVKFGFN